MEPEIMPQFRGEKVAAVSAGGQIDMRTLIVAFVAAVAASALPAAQSNMAQPEKLTAFAVDMSNTASRANTTPVDITITRWTTDTERDNLKEMLDKGQDALLHALQKLPVVGYLNTPGSLRWDLHFARQKALPDGGQSIILATDRYVTAWEAFHQPRTIDYPFTVIQLQLDKSGHGVGKASIATRITQDEDGTIELENFSSEPVMLNDVHPMK
jgi:hypothetical protein